jgi:hypothetical protein
MDLLNRTNKGMKFKVGKIDINKSFTVFGIDSRNAEKIIQSMNGTNFENRKLILKFDGGSGSSTSYSKSPDRKRRKR